MDRTERILDLIAGLSAAKHPVPLAEIRAWFPADYDEPGEEAAMRKFERDKKDLLELGVPLRWVEPDDDQDGGYLVDREWLHLPPLELTPDEAAIVYLSGLQIRERPGFPWRAALGSALQKIELAGGAPDREGSAVLGRRVVVDHSASPAALADTAAALDQRLVFLGRAVDDRKRVTFTYHALWSGWVTSREVDPYGLFCHRGEWMLVGHSHERGAIRTFFVRRMQELEVNAKKPGTHDFHVPASFRLREWIDPPPWRFEVHDAVAVTVDVDEDHAWIAERDLRAAGTDAGGGKRRFVVQASNVEALVGWVLGLAPHARIASPPDAADRAHKALVELFARHTAAGTGSGDAR